MIEEETQVKNPKIGDKVKIIKDTVVHYIPIGKIVTLKSIYSYKNWYNDYNNNFISENDFIIIRENNKIKITIQNNKNNELNPIIRATINGKRYVLETENVCNFLEKYIPTNNYHFSQKENQKYKRLIID